MGLCFCLIRDVRAAGIEDDQGARDTIALYLRLEGYQVETAATGQEGLQACAKFVPGVVLLDYRLPDINGLECLRRIRGDPNSSHPAVAVMTADWAVQQRMTELRQLDAVLLTKPCFCDEIAAFVASVA